MRISPLFFALVLPLAACDVTKSDFPVQSQSVQAEAEEIDSDVVVIRLSQDNIEAFNTPRNLQGSGASFASDEMTYLVGTGDILNVVIWDHPELTMPAGETRTPSESGLRVGPDGTFFYPYVGQVRATGRSPEAIRADLTAQLKKFIPDPQVEVRVVEYRSQAVSITGEVETPKRQALTDTPLTLLDAIDAAGGLTEDADPRHVSIRRGAKTYHVDLQAFLERGAARNNPILRGGDVVSVGRASVEEAFLLGQIVKTSTVDLTHENISLTQAITRAGGIHDVQADARGIFVFRDTEMGITVYQLDASNPTAYLIGTKFVLHPQDVVYVTTAPLYRWNRLISSLLPTLTTVRTGDQIGSN